MGTSPFEINGAVLTVFDASAAHQTNHLTYAGGQYEASAFIPGVTHEIDEMLTLGALDSDGDPTVDDLYIRVGPGTIAALWATEAIDADTLDEADGCRVPKVAIKDAKGETYMLDVVVDKAFDGAAAMIGDAFLKDALATT